MMQDVKACLRFVRYFHGHLLFMIVGLACTMVGVAAGIAQPLISKNLFDDALPRSDLGLLARLGLMIGALFLAERAAGILRGYVFMVSRSRILLALRSELFAKIQSLPWEFHNSRRVGYLMDRINGDVSRLRVLLPDGIVQKVADIVQLAVVLGVLLHMQWRLAVITIGAMVAFAVYALGSVGPVRRLTEEAREAWAVSNAELQEGLVGIRTVQATCSEQVEVERQYKVTKIALDADLKAQRLSLVLSNLGQFISSGVPVTVLLYGAYLIVKGQLSLGELMAVSMYFQQAFGISRRVFVAGGVGVQQSLVSLRRIFELLDLRYPIALSNGKGQSLSIKGHVALRGVSFSYQASSEVFSDVSFNVEAGMMVAIVGPSGCGKTTLTQLLARFYDPDRGCVLIDGQDVRALELRCLRQQLGYVQQEQFFFDRTVRENITLGLDRVVHESEIEKVAEFASAAEFVEGLPERYSTRLGPNGVTLSAGQKQRLAIAREMLRDPRILILDEATSALDAVSQSLVEDAIREVARNRTTFVVTHKLASIVSADKIVVLENGRVVQEGVHRDLICDSGLYRELYERGR